MLIYLLQNNFSINVYDQKLNFRVNATINDYSICYKWNREYLKI